jgi:hypothetical protein
MRLQEGFETDIDGDTGEPRDSSGDENQARDQNCHGLRRDHSSPTFEASFDAIPKSGGHPKSLASACVSR